MDKQQAFSPDRRKHQRHSVNIPASVRMQTGPDTVPIESSEAFISDISYRGACVNLTVETTAKPEDLTKMFTRRRVCHVFCRLPGNTYTSCLCGTVAWLEPRRVASGAQIRIGISLEDSDETSLAGLSAFVKTREEANSKRQR